MVDGYLAKDGSHLVDARRVTLPDGRRIDGGSEGMGDRLGNRLAAYKQTARRRVVCFARNIRQKQLDVPDHVISYVQMCLREGTSLQAG